MICFSIYNETFLDFTDVPSCVLSGVCDAERRMWICKPTGLNRGRGIFLLKSREEVEAFRLKLQLLDDGRKRPQRRPQACVVQRWVNTRCLRGLIFSAELEVQSVSVKSARLLSHSLSYPLEKRRRTHHQTQKQPRRFSQLHPEAAAAGREEVRRALVPPDRLHFTLHGLLWPRIRAADLRRLRPRLKQSVHPPDQSGTLSRFLYKSKKQKQTNREKGSEPLKHPPWH